MKTILSVVTLLATTTALANASSATLPESDSLIYFWDFSTDVNPTKGTVDGGSFTSCQNGYGTLSQQPATGDEWWSYGTGPYVDKSKSTGSATGIYANAFTFSFDVSKVVATNWHNQNLLSIYTNNGTEDTNALMVQMAPETWANDTSTEHGNVMLYIGGIAQSTATSYFGGATTSASTAICAHSAVTGDIWTRITISSDGSNFKVYVNGDLKQTLTLTTGAEAITGFQIGASLESGSRTLISGDFDNIAFWNKALTENQVKTLSFSVVPEPSAFGFLAGLEVLSLAVACRRRRSC